MVSRGVIVQVAGFEDIADKTTSTGKIGHVNSYPDPIPIASRCTDWVKFDGPFDAGAATKPLIQLSACLKTRPQYTIPASRRN